ncbi:NAD(P)/FAD-dependent oxidoreductase [Microbacterium thalassium]|uniref:3-phenylpropionate/trans-cinnamate dioxygenase ferredoxin reductase subunit n=1 Tax=Microbacterium thalassium TaxID=362649 RepID=A0A7X0KVU1_9MICO|nr:FAD-dependent oxidoreductase [Microbacterium thalassium]MBB6392553.1 3-phenylpropionate/trans-cinnamate dioxygenase ferredoxin reductase subunit [Microbacterium thalassium]GLK23216.1 pyridine nucleotide-disulfide oxidoreductase [Microbacterium thalassium]
MVHHVIIGGGQAAGSAAETLRKRSPDADVTVVAAEQHPPYQRPPLSKGYLAGDEGADAVVLHSAEWYGEQGIDLRTATRATAIDPAGHRVRLADGTDLAYDALLVATGASPRRLPLPGAHARGVHVLRTIDDADALAESLRHGGRRVAVIGTGWIGMEVAATARGLGNDVTVLGRAPVPLGAALGPRMGEVFAGLHRDHGVTIRSSASVDALVVDGAVSGVVADGETVAADIVVIGVGATPDTALAEAAGIRVQDGILADEHLRTSAPDVYAAGDVARSYHPLVQRHLRSEHWENARAGGEVAARSMLGEDVRHTGIPYFYTDQFDLGMELSGFPTLMTDADVVVRGDLEAREFIAFWLDDGRVVAGMNVNVWDVQDDIQALIRSGARVEPDALRDPGVDIAGLAA